MPGTCAAALVLLLDASGSGSAGDWRLQVWGTADGIADASVVRIIERQGAVAMTAIASSDLTVPMVPWTVLPTPADWLRDQCGDDGRLRARSQRVGRFRQRDAA